MINKLDKNVARELADMAGGLHEMVFDGYDSRTVSIDTYEALQHDASRVAKYWHDIARDMCDDQPGLNDVIDFVWTVKHECGCESGDVVDLYNYFHPVQGPTVSKTVPNHMDKDVARCLAVEIIDAMYDYDPYGVDGSREDNLIETYDDLINDPHRLIDGLNCWRKDVHDYDEDVETEKKLNRIIADIWAGINYKKAVVVK